jgi:DNA-directed RNA polymerase subunit RPC12/RpoP
MSYVCGSCGHRLKRLSSSIGYCSNCGQENIQDEKKQDQKKEELEKEDEIR